MVSHIHYLLSEKSEKKKEFKIPTLPILTHSTTFRKTVLNAEHLLVQSDTSVYSVQTPGLSDLFFGCEFAHRVNFKEVSLLCVSTS